MVTTGNMGDIFKSKGIVFRNMKYSESSVIVDIYTLEKGMRSFIVSGLSSKKNRSKAICFHHLNIIDIVAYDKEGTALARIKEQRLGHHYSKMLYDVVRSSIGLFTLEVSRNTIKEHEPNPDLYHYIESFLKYLDICDGGYGLLSIKFMLDLTTHLGISPMGSWSEASPLLDLYNGIYINQETKYTIDTNTSKLLSSIHKTHIEDLERISTSKAQRDFLLDQMVMYYKLHIDHFKELKSLDVLRSIF